METAELHTLTPAYALDALSDEEARAYEEHLRSCAACREELAELREAATSLAFAVEGPAPPAALRERILDAARAERSNVVPLRRRPFLPVVSGVAAVAAILAVALGLWAVSLSRSLEDERTALEQRERALAVVASAGTRTIALDGGAGLLAVSPDGEAVLVLRDLAPAPSDRVYEAWVIEGDEPVPAGTFDAEGDAAVHLLAASVDEGDTVAVTLEPKGGSLRPTSPLLLSARA